VEEVDYKRRLVYCEQVKGKVPAFFGLCPGDINTKVLENEGYPEQRDNVCVPHEKRRSQVERGRHTAVHSG
jgi:hypothetical protein